MFKKVIKFFDKLEDKIRFYLSKKPIIYAIIAGIAIVLFWRGVWMLADKLNISALFSFILSLVLMLLTGTFVSFFIGEQILISGLKKEKRLEEITEKEIKTELDLILETEKKLEELMFQVKEIKDRFLKEK